MIKWAIALDEFGISYQPKLAEKGQVVADFIVDFTYLVDIVSTPKEMGCGARLVLTTPDKVAMEYALRFKFKASNNEAEYEAFLTGLRLAKHLEVTNNFDAKDSSMAAYLAQTQLLLKHFHYQITQIPRVANSHADALAHLTLAVENKIGRNIQVELLAAPSTMAAEIRYKATHYLIINDQLYKRGFNLPYLRCLTPTKVEIVIREIYEEVCRDHAGSRSLAHKAFHQGYYWPTLHQDAIRISRSCDKCQRYVTIPHSPLEPLTPMISHWPLAQWRLDLIGPMPARKGKVRYAIVAVDYFTKFGIPNAIVTDNGQQFNNNKFRMFCSKFNMNLCFTSPAHPQSNGQFEAINKIIKRTLKTSLDKAKVVGISRPGPYKLRSSDGKTLGHPWNTNHLRYYYK
ncbi:hypothetical protein ACFX1T_022826 [Malus domestica]